MSSTAGALFKWPRYSPAATERDPDALQRKWEELLSRSPNGLVPPNDEQKSGESDLTIHEWLQQNPDTAELVRYLERVPSIKDMLQDGQSTCTIWAPTNAAFAGFDLDDSQLESLLQHHITPHEMPLVRILGTPNVPTLARPTTLNGMMPLRLRPSPQEIQVNGHGTITHSDIRAKNGLIHLVDHVIFLPPLRSELISFAPEGQFTRLRQALQKTGLADDLASSKFVGYTLFTPTDEAFVNLGSEVEAFLDSPEGTRYLRALLQYHMVPSETLYSNMFYHGENESGTTTGPIGHKPPAPDNAPALVPPAPSSTETKTTNPAPQKQPEKGPRLIKGKRSFPLPTALDGAWINVDIARCGGIISMFVREGQATVVTQDLMASDGVVHVIDRVLLPPHKSSPLASELDATESNLESLPLEVEQLKAVLESHLQGE